jgi:hypothetical protein
VAGITRIKESDARGLLSKERSFYKKVAQLGLENDYKQRLEEITESPSKLSNFLRN